MFEKKNHWLHAGLAFFLAGSLCACAAVPGGKDGKAGGSNLLSAPVSGEVDGVSMEIQQMEKARTTKNGLPAGEGKVYLRFVIQVTNNSNEPAGVSSGMNFNGFADGEDLSQALLDSVEGVELIGAGVDLQPGESTIGYISYTAPENASVYAVEYDAQVFNPDNETLVLEIPNQ